MSEYGSLLDIKFLVRLAETGGCRSVPTGRYPPNPQYHSLEPQAASNVVRTAIEDSAGSNHEVNPWIDIPTSETWAMASGNCSN